MQSYISVKKGAIIPHRNSLTNKRKSFKHQQQQQQLQQYQQPHLYRTKSEDRRAWLKSCCQKTIAFLFTQVGCGALLVGYTILGAIIFIELESPTESRRVSEVTLIKKQIVGQLWNVTHHYNVIHTETWRTQVELIVETFQNALVREIRLGYDGSSDPIWTFPAALMYSLSVFTTIGYGNLTPKTDWGKAVTIFYALFGIPLLLLYFSNVGNFLATSLREFYSSFYRFKVSFEDHRRRKKKRKKGGVEEKVEGLGESEEKFRGEKSEVEGRVEGRVGEGGDRTWEDGHGRGGDGLLEDVKEEEEEEEGEKGPPNEYWTNEVTIPIPTCLAVFSMYIVMGSVVFSWWEEWNYLDGSYFCFISLVTIGFGDLVPADTTHSQRSRTRVDGQLIFCSIYLLVGMGLMAMLFHLTQERFFLMARRIGKLLHLI